MAESSFHLSVSDQCAARVFIQTLQIFSFPDDNQAEAAIQTLGEALQVTLVKFPFLAGTVGPADAKTGKISLSYPTEIQGVHDTSRLPCKKLTHPSEFAHTYASLKRAGMPPSAFPGEVFCPYALRDRKGIPPYAEGMLNARYSAPVLAVQAFFIPGGLVLSTYVHHSVMDFSGINSFWRTFADNVYHRRSMQGQVRDADLHQSHMRAQVDARIPEFEKTPSADAFTDTPFEYQRTLADDTSCSAKIFVINAAKIRGFRDELRKNLPDNTRLTICNVLASLIWIHVTRARSARMTACGHQVTHAGIAVDLRRRIEPALNEDYMGVMAFFTKATRCISDFLVDVTPTLVLRTALEINRTISRVDNAWVSRHLAFFKSKVPIRDTEPALRFRFGPDLYITSWMNFGAEHCWNIPGTSSEAPDRIRRTKDGNADGGIIIMPRSRLVVDGEEAPYEILVRLATEDMQRLMDEEGGLASWAERIIE